MAHADSRTLVKPPRVRERRGRGIIVREGHAGEPDPGGTTTRDRPLLITGRQHGTREDPAGSPRSL